MPRQKSLVGVIREMVRDEVGNAIQSLLGGISTRRAATNGRRRRRTRGTWRPGGPGRPPKKAGPMPVPPKAKTVRRRRRRRRGPGRPPGSKKKAA